MHCLGIQDAPVFKLSDAFEYLWRLRDVSGVPFRLLGFSLEQGKLN